MQYICMCVAFEVFGANSLVMRNVVLFHTTSNHFNSSEGEHSRSKTSAIIAIVHCNYCTCLAT